MKSFNRDETSENDDLDNLFDRAIQACTQGRLAEAVELGSTAVRVEPDTARHLARLGLILMEARQLRAAVESLRKAVFLEPKSAVIWSQLGEALRRSQKFASAEVCHRRALELCPSEAAFFYRRARNLASQGRDEAALPMLEHALRLDPDFVFAAWERGVCLRRIGDLAAGWRDYPLRFDHRLKGPRYQPNGTVWDGSPFPGKTLLVLMEQGFGDAIWASRYLNKVKSIGGRLVVQCGYELRELFRGLTCIDEFVPVDANTQEYDEVVPCCSLPGLFTLTDRDICPKPYLRANPARLARFSRWLKMADQRMRVGIVWSGSVDFAENDARRVSLRAMVEHFNLPEVQLFSLQKGPPARELNQFIFGPGANQPISLGPLLNDFADSAAVISKMDLVITTDTAVAHLTGALGIPGWLLLGLPAYWLWGRTGNQTAWYESLRLFRSSSASGLQGPLDLAAAQLLEMTSKR